MEDAEKKKENTIWESMEVAGNQLVDRVKELAAEGSVRQLRIIADDGDVFLETPLNIGLAVSGVVVLAAPWLAVLGVIAGLVSKVRIEVERVEQPKPKIEKKAEEDDPEDYPV